MNRGMNLPQIQRIMSEFEKESATMDMKEEMMSDAVDDVMDEEDEEEESDKILRQVLDELGVAMAHEVRSIIGRYSTLQLLTTNRSSRMHLLASLSPRHSPSRDRPSPSAKAALLVAVAEVEAVEAGTCQTKMPYKPDLTLCGGDRLDTSCPCDPR